MTNAPLVPPEPQQDWTNTHKLNDTIQGLVVERNDYESKDGTPFSVIIIESGDGQSHRVPCSRNDLRPLIEREDIAIGDEVAITYWGQQGQKFVYTFAVRKLQDNQGQLS
jgi:hypothetical protein